MATDPNKKTLRHFQCRDYLWETFEQMSAELECSVDYLINEAMRQYARSRSFTRSSPGQPTGSVTMPPPSRELRESGPPTMPPGAASQPAMPSMPQPNRAPLPPAASAAARPQPVAPPRQGGIPPMPANAGGAMPRIPSMPGMPAAGTRPSAGGAPAMPLGPRPGGPQLPPLTRGPAVPPVAQRQGPPAFPTPSNPMGHPRPPMPSSGPPPMPRSSPPAMQPMAEPAHQAPVPGVATLYAMYQGERYPVAKEEFIIGRGQKTSDLVIRDSNVSRRHAVVVLHNGQYWMVDQQSTNGVEFMGAKIDRKRIDEGDVFKICDYEIAFTYR